MNNLVFVDCEANGPCPGLGELTEFGAVLVNGKHFYGDVRDKDITGYTQVFEDFATWLTAEVPKPYKVFVSDNPAFDWQWINHGFWVYLGHNPFGHSARRISDFYAGLCGDFRKTQNWKRLRVTKHTHNPVDDARGNMEAFVRIINGER